MWGRDWNNGSGTFLAVQQLRLHAGGKCWITHWGTKTPQSLKKKKKKDLLTLPYIIKDVWENQFEWCLELKTKQAFDPYPKRHPEVWSWGLLISLWTLGPCVTSWLRCNSFHRPYLSSHIFFLLLPARKSLEAGTPTPPANSKKRSAPQ